MLCSLLRVLHSEMYSIERSLSHDTATDHDDDEDVAITFVARFPEALPAVSKLGCQRKKHLDRRKQTGTSATQYQYARERY